jgi:hypothetical protein
MPPFLRTAAPVDINYLIVRHKQTLVIDFKESEFLYGRRTYWLKFVYAVLDRHTLCLQYSKAYAF